VQSLGEFFSVVTRGATPRLPVERAARQVELLTQSWPLLDVTPLVVLEAIRGTRERRMHYWDAQLWATARLNQIPVILSEDFSSGAIVDGIRFENPFAAGFELERWC
jgi:predicted nucleic acid-binding protein